MIELLIKYRLPLKLQIISWFLLSKSIGQHITSYQRLIEVKEDIIIINTYELSEFYHVKFIEGKIDDWSNGLISFLAPKLSRFIYDLEDNTQFFTMQIVHKGNTTTKTIKLKSEL